MVENIKGELFDSRVISKKHDQTGRDGLAGEQRDVRARRDELNIEMAEKESAITERRKNLLFILKDKFRISDEVVNRLEEELNGLRHSYEELPNVHEMVDAYYEAQRQRPLSQEEKREFLTEDLLCSLSEEEYVLLWRRLNPFFLAHVTRQGFRDHNAMFYHSAGMREFHGGFVASLEDGKMLRPPIAIDGLRARDKESVRTWLSQWVLQAENEQMARERLFNLLNHSLASAPTYPDKTAVHFAAELVADGYYGGERGNEVFYIYPTDYLASQHNFSFNGWEKDFTRPQSETKWNDVFIWPGNFDNPGITLDSGIVFLPESAQVDPSTGSTYASEIVASEDGKDKLVMIEDSSLAEGFVNWFKGLGQDSVGLSAYREYMGTDNYFAKERAKGACVDIIAKSLQAIGIEDGASYRMAHSLIGVLYIWKPEEISGDELREVVTKAGAQWKRPSRTISSREYWEKYFEEHPEKRPKHIYYYRGSPSAAVHDFFEKHGIGKADTSEKDGPLLGFGDHHVVLRKGFASAQDDKRALAGYDELMAIGGEIIGEHYSSVQNING